MPEKTDHEVFKYRLRRKRRKQTKQKKPAETRTDAAASLFGWQFQIAAAIYLMLETFDENKSIKLEGKRQDIEITKKTGDIHYIQAKAMLEPICPIEEKKISKYNSQVYGHLDKAITSLVDAYENMTAEERAKCKRMEYISNLEYPLGNLRTAPWRGFKRFKCKKLHPVEMDSLKYSCDRLTEQIEDVLSVSHLTYLNDDNTKTGQQEVLEIIKSFLLKLRIDTAFCYKYLKTMHVLCYHNGSCRNVQMTNEEFVWPAIVHRLEFDEDEFDDMFDEVDVEAADILSKYEDIIIDTKCRMVMSFRILGEYNSFMREVASKRERLAHFLNERALLLCRDELIEIPDDDREPLAKYIVYKIVKARGVFNLANNLLK